MARTSSRSRIRTHLESLGRDAARQSQEQTIGRFKTSGAPLTGHRRARPRDARRPLSRTAAPDHPRGRAHPRRRTVEQRRRAAAPSRLQLRGRRRPADRGARRGPVLHLLPEGSRADSSCASSRTSRSTTRSATTWPTPSSAVFACPPGVAKRWLPRRKIVHVTSHVQPRPRCPGPPQLHRNRTAASVHHDLRRDRTMHGSSQFPPPVRRRRGRRRSSSAVTRPRPPPSTSASATVTPKATGKVLLVGDLPRRQGAYAVDPGRRERGQADDWILVAPGDYHETDDLHEPARQLRTSRFGGVLDHDAGPAPSRHEPQRRHRRRHEARFAAVLVEPRRPGVRQRRERQGRRSNGIVVFKANGVSIENLTVCNFLAGSRRLRATASGGTAATAPEKIGLTGYAGRLPHGHDDLLRRRGDGRRRTASSPQTPRAPACGTRSTPTTRTTRACTWAPASSCATSRSRHA